MCRRSIRLLCGKVAATVTIFAASAAVPLSPVASQSQFEESSELIDYRRNVELVLGDGRMVHGEGHFQIPQHIDVRHTRDRITYSRRIHPDEIRRIEFLSWRGEPDRQNRNGEWIYRFRVVRFSIELYDGTLLHRDGEPFPFLRAVTLVNENGRTTLFSYWLDLQRGDGSWYTGLRGSADQPRSETHEDVVRSMHFQPPLTPAPTAAPTSAPTTATPTEKEPEPLGPLPFPIDPE